MEQRKGGMAKSRKTAENGLSPYRRESQNGRTAEITRNPKRWNGKIFPEILRDGIAEQFDEWLKTKSFFAFNTAVSTLGIEENWLLRCLSL